MSNKIEKSEKDSKTEQDAQHSHMRPGESVETEKAAEQQADRGVIEHMRPGEGTDGQQWKEGEPLPNADKAEVGTKFETYSMDPTNERAKNKWKAFEQVGYDVHSEAGRKAGAQDVTDQLHKELPTAPATKDRASESIYGQRLIVRSKLEGPNGKDGTLVTFWQYDIGSENPRMITNRLEVHRYKEK